MLEDSGLELGHLKVHALELRWYLAGDLIVVYPADEGPS